MEGNVGNFTSSFKTYYTSVFHREWPDKRLNPLLYILQFLNTILYVESVLNFFY